AGGGGAARARGLVSLPAGRADDDVDAVARQRRHVGFDGIGKAEIDRDIDAAPLVLLRSAAMERRLRVDDASHLEPVLGSEIADEAAHPTMADQQYAHPLNLQR